MSENIVSEKMKRSVYQDYPDYKDEPFSTSKKFGVYIPKLNDQVSDLIERHEEKIRAKNKAKLGGVHDTNIFSQNFDQDPARTTEHCSHEMFGTSGRSAGCNHCNPAAAPTLTRQVDGQITGSLCPCCRNASHCCCKNKFRIRRASSKCDSAYSYDTNVWKTKLHGPQFGYYGNSPYQKIGGHRKPKEHHPPVLADSGALLAMPCTKGLTARHFEQSLMMDPRTGERLGRHSVNPVVNTLLRESCTFRKNQAVQEGIMRLKETGCLDLPCERIRRARPLCEKGYVDNDFHSKGSKNGYTRSFGGRTLV